MQEQHTGADDKERHQQRGARVAVRPEREVEKDPGAAGEREEREDQADEGDVDGEGLRDSRANPSDHALVSAAGEGGQRHAASS